MLIGHDTRPFDRLGVKAARQVSRNHQAWQVVIHDSDRRFIFDGHEPDLSCGAINGLVCGLWSNLSREIDEYKCS